MRVHWLHRFRQTLPPALCAKCLGMEHDKVCSVLVNDVCRLEISDRMTKLAPIWVRQCCYDLLRSSWFVERITSVMGDCEGQRVTPARAVTPAGAHGTA